MSTLPEIENAINALPPTEQESLLHWLESKLAAKSGHTIPKTSRNEWLTYLAELRQRGQMPHEALPLQQMMDDLRGV